MKIMSTSTTDVEPGKTAFPVPLSPMVEAVLPGNEDGNVPSVTANDRWIVLAVSVFTIVFYYSLFALSR